MTWLGKMDAVLNCLYEHSGDNPRFTDLQEWLNGQPIEKGELQDITLYFYNEGLMYLEYGGDRNHKYYEHQDSRYLISSSGKTFWEETGGFVNQKATSNFHNKTLKGQAKATLRLTVVLAFAAIPVGLLALADLYHHYKWFRSTFWWGIVGLIILISFVTAYIVYKLLNRNKLR